MEMRVKDDRENGQTSVRPFITREFNKPSMGEKQMTTLTNSVGASSVSQEPWDKIS